MAGLCGKQTWRGIRRNAQRAVARIGSDQRAADDQDRQMDGASDQKESGALLSTMSYRL